MPVESLQTGYQTKKEIDIILKKILYRLSKDNTSKKTDLVEAVQEYLNAIRPDINGLSYLIYQSYYYLNKLDKSSEIVLYNSVKELLTPLELLVNNANIGTVEISNNAAKEHVFGASYREIENQLRTKTYSLDPSKASILDIVEKLMEVLNSDNDLKLKAAFDLDMVSGKLGASTIIERLGSSELDSRDQYKLMNSIYNAATDGKFLSDFSPINALNKVIVYASSKINPNTGNKWTEKELFESMKNWLNLGYYYYNNSYLNSYYYLAILIYISLVETIGSLDGPFEDSFNDLISAIYYTSINMINSGMSAKAILENILAIDADSITDKNNLAQIIFETFNYVSLASINSVYKALQNGGIVTSYYSSLPDMEAVHNNLQNYYENLMTGNYYNHKELASAIFSTSSSDIEFYYNNQAFPSSVLIDNLELDLISSNLPVSKIANNFGFAKAYEEEFYQKIISSPNPSFSNFLVYDWYFSSIYGITTSFNLGEHYLPFTYKIESSLELTSTIMDDFVSQVKALALNSEINDHTSLSYSLASLITPFSSEVAEGLKLDIITAGQDINRIKHYLTFVNGASASIVAANIYNAWGGAYLSSVNGASSLASSIDENLIGASDISQFFTQNSLIEKKYDQTDNYFIASNLNYIVNAGSSNDQLLTYLGLDLNASGKTPSEIIEILQNIEGDNGAKITYNLYKSLGFPYDSGIEGKVLLASAIGDYYNSDYVTTLASLAGNKSLSPKYKYLNYCSKNNDVYEVIGSIFKNFDDDSLGKSLYDMKELYSESGRLSARAQCGKFIVDNIGEDLYVTVSQPAGVSGTADATGCGYLIDPAILLAMCNTVFDANIA